MPKSKKPTNARRHLNLSPATEAQARTTGEKIIENPYINNKSSSAAANTVGTVDATTNFTTASKVTPDVGIEKFFVSDRKAGGAKPSAARKLVTDADRVESDVATKGRKRKKSHQRTNSEDDDVAGLYYHSDGERRGVNAKRESRQYEPGHIQSTLAYYQRGELPLGRGTLRAYRYVRDHFLIPRDIEVDPKFGAHSGSCFEERVLRAYALGLLDVKADAKDCGPLLVCSHCGDEGHIRDDCSELLF